MVWHLTNQQLGTYDVIALKELVRPLAQAARAMTHLQSRPSEKERPPSRNGTSEMRETTIKKQNKITQKTSSSLAAAQQHAAATAE